MPSSPIQLNLSDPLLYEHLGIIVNEFERAALVSGTREGFLAVSDAPLTAMDSILESADDALGANDATPDDDTPATGESAFQTSPFEVTTEDGDQDGLPEVRTYGSVSLDADLEDILGGGDRAEMAASYLRDCIGCDLRLQFAWQLQPINLLGPVAELLKDINLALDSFQRQMDPFQTLDSLCDMLNNLRMICIPDLIGILLGLKMLLKKYLSFALELRLDWTVIIGPLLKLILDGVMSLIANVAGVITAPLDCAEGAIRTFENLEREVRQVAGVANAVGQRVSDRAEQAGGVAESIRDEYPGVQVEEIDGETLDAHVVHRDVIVEDNRVSTRDRRASEAEPDNPRIDGSFPAGFTFADNVTLPEALRDNRFGLATWNSKLLLALKDAKDYIMDLVRKVNGAVNSLKSLVGGGLSLQLGNLGLLLFIRDMIALMTMIIRMLRDNQNVNDWCAYITENPEALRPYLANFSNQRVSLEAEDDRVALMVGPERVGEIKTCLTERSNTPQAELLQQWIADLKRGGDK